MRSLIILSDSEIGYAEDFVLRDAFNRRGCVAIIRDWKAPDLVEFLDIQKIDCVIIRSAWDYTDKIELFLSRIRELSAVIELVNPLETILWNINKKYLCHMLDLDVPVVPSLFIDSLDLEVIKSGLAGFGGEDFILKAAVGAGSRQMVRLSKGTFDSKSCLPPFSNGHGAILQPYEPDIVTRGEWALFYFSGKLVYSVLKTAADGDFRIQRQYGGAERKAMPPTEVQSVAQKAMRHVPGSPIFMRIDVLDSKPSPKLMEIEAIEPRLYFDVFPEFAEMFVDAILTS